MVSSSYINDTTTCKAQQAKIHESLFNQHKLFRIKQISKELGTNGTQVHVWVSQTIYGRMCDAPESDTLKKLNGEREIASGINTKSTIRIMTSLTLMN